MAKTTRRGRRRPKQIMVNYERGAGFRHLFADGTLVRTVGDNLVITFYVEDRVRSRQMGKLSEGSTYDLLPIQEDPVRTQLAEVRLPFVAGRQLASLVFEKIHAADPDVLEGSNVIVQRDAASAEGKTNGRKRS